MVPGQSRPSEDDCDLLDRAAAALGTDRSSFLLAQGRLAAQRVLANREHFLLDAAAHREWERINSRPAHAIPAPPATSTAARWIGPRAQATG